MKMEAFEKKKKKKKSYKNEKIFSLKELKVQISKMNFNFIGDNQ